MKFQLSSCLPLFVLLLFSNLVSHAQLCQGSLGDPIVNTSFGAGTNPGPPLAAATTNYQYVTTDCPVDGFYTVRNNTLNCFGNTWFNITSDHTGDPGGYFMLVNASIQPSAFYLDTVHNLCASTTFEFAAWVINVLNTTACGGTPILPDLTFRIEKTDGTILQSYNTNSIPVSNVPTWKQYGFFFITPPGVADIVLRIINNAPGGCGNDLALDDITFRPCGPQITPSITGYPSNSVSYCAGAAQTFQLNASLSAGFNNPAYQWQQNFNNGGWNDLAGDTTSNFTTTFPVSTPPGSYKFRVAVTEQGNINSLQCRVISDTISIIINAPPVTSATNNGPACTRASLHLNASGGSQYSWTGPNAFNSAIANPVKTNIQFVDSGTYYVLVTNAAGCQAMDSTFVTVNPSPTASTAFSDTTICAGSSVTLSGNGGSNWLWVPSTGLSASTILNPVATPADTTLYLFYAGNPFGCRDSAFTRVNIIKKPLVDAGPDRTILAGNSIQLNGAITGQYSSFAWFPPLYIDNIQVLRPVVTPPGDMDYILTATALNACGLVSDTMHIRVLGAVFVPNAFTPNGDGLNDTWNIPALVAYTNFQLLVFDRYGELVFRSENTMKAWDGKFKGKDLPAGAYTYILNLHNGFDPLKGTVLLIR